MSVGAWITAILGAISAVGGIVATVKYWSQIVVWATTKTPEQKDQTIDQQVEENKQQAEESGRPV